MLELVGTMAAPTGTIVVGAWAAMLVALMVDQSVEGRASRTAAWLAGVLEYSQAGV